MCSSGIQFSSVMLGLHSTRKKYLELIDHKIWLILFIAQRHKTHCCLFLGFQAKVQLIQLFTNHWRSVWEHHQTRNTYIMDTGAHLLSRAVSASIFSWFTVYGYGRGRYIRAKTGVRLHATYQLKFECTGVYIIRI